MAREMNSLFMPNPPMEAPHRMFSLQDFPPISDSSMTVAPKIVTIPAQANGNFGSTSTFEPERRVNNFQANQQQQQLQSYAPLGMQAGFGNRHIPSLMEPPQNIQGLGRLSWLSSKGGLITTADGKSISFQSKEFCDETLNDLVSVLRNGFTLKFNANHNENNQYTATHVSPVYGEEAEQIFKMCPEIDLESANPQPPNSKEPYSLELELGAYKALLSVFERQGMHKIQLSCLHSQMSSYTDERLFRYVGTSSMKRRQFVERRTHLFYLQNDDSITLQYPAVYELIFQMAHFLLRRSGIASIQCLYNFYMSNEVAQCVRDFIGYDRQSFMSLLNTHNFIFAMFPNRSFVSIRRNLPIYDYTSLVTDKFPQMLTLQQQNSARNYQVQRGMYNQMSNGMHQRGQSQNYQMQHRQYQAPPSTIPSNGGRLMMHADNQLTSPQGDNNWASLSNLGTWSNQPSNSQTRQPSRTNSTHGLDMFVDPALMNDFGNLQSLRQNDLRVSTGVQADEAIIGGASCVCKCVCGRGGSSPNNTANNAGVIGSSLGLPTINPGVNNFGSIGSRGTRPTSMSTTSSEEQPTFSESYNLFGPNDVLRGSLDSLRLGNL